MTTKTKCIEIILGHIREQVLNLPESLTLDTPLLEGGVLDSFATVQLIACLEDEFKIVIPDEDLGMENFSSVNKMADYVIKRLSHR